MSYESEEFKDEIARSESNRRTKMFPGAHAQVYYNSEGEPLGWDAAPYDNEPYEPDDYEDMPEPEDELTELCHEESDLEFVATYGAPGVGQAWKCKVCDKEWSKVGGTFFEPEAQAHILTEEDVR